MKISFDGLRTNATHSMNRLYNTIKGIIESDDISDYEKKELKETLGFNDNEIK